MATFDGLTKVQITSGLSGSVEDRCKCLEQIANYGEGAANYLGYGADVGRCLKDPSRDVKIAALKALACMGSCGASNVELVATYMKDANVEMKCAAVAALGAMGIYSAKYEQEVAELHKDQEPAIRAAAAKTLGGMKASRQIDVMKKCLSDPEAQVVVGACEGAGLLGDLGSKIAANVAACLANQDAGVRLAAIAALTKMGEQANKLAGHVVACLADDNNLVRQAAVSYFSEVVLGFEAFKKIVEIEALLTHKDGRAQAAAAVALGNIQTNHQILMDRLTQERTGDGPGDLPKKAKPLPFATAKLIALLDSSFEDVAVLALAAACVEPKPSVELRRPACAAASTLGLLACSDAAAPIGSKLSADSPKEVTANFLSALGGMNELPSSVAPRVRTFVNDTSPLVRAGACVALGAGEESSAEYLAAKMEDPHPAVRAGAAQGIGKMQAARYSDGLCTLLGDQAPKVQIAAMRALARLGPKGEAYASEIAKLALTGSDGVRIAATEVLVSMGEHGAAFAEEMTLLFQDTQVPVRKAGLDALAKMGEGAKPFLSSAQSMVNDPVNEVRFAAEAAVAALRLA